MESCMGSLCSKRFRLVSEQKRPWKGIFGFEREIKQEPWAIDSESIRARGIIVNYHYY